MTMAEVRTALGLTRRFTVEGTHPYDMVEWETRDARIENHTTGAVAFEQRNVEFPKDWSQNATNIVAQKYFRGSVGHPNRECSLRQVIDRIVDTYTLWGLNENYFNATEAQVFSDELKYLMVTQRMAFNSPVWFNIGVEGVPQQASACFILSVEDTMDSILNWYREEGMIFKGGSGAGVNLSNIRSSVEALQGGGTASGPVSFMRGADASAGTIKSGGKTRRAAKMVILDVTHPDIEEFIWLKAREEEKIRVLRDAGFDMSLDGRDMTSVQYQNANNSVRVTDEFMEAVEADSDWHLRAVTTGEVVRTVRARDLFRQMMEATWACADPGMQFSTTINRWHTAPNFGPINGSNPCSEYMHVDNSACNLASLNLLKFLDEETNTFNTKDFVHACQITFLAQEISISGADFPTEAITENTLRFRQIGMGYANLGATLMALGVPYDSDSGRTVAATITALMTGAGYAMSGRVAGRLGPFDGYGSDSQAMNRVLRMHRDALTGIDTTTLPEELQQRWEQVKSAAEATWDEAVHHGTVHGVRNAQATVLAPTGTIGLAMDCDTTGIEPDLGLVKSKSLVGGGTMLIINQTVPRALRRLGYTDEQITEIGDYIKDNKSLIGAPHITAEHLPVFACSMGDNVIEPLGHVRMMAAVQPWISGAISKTVNVPEDTDVDTLADIHLEAWRLGVKALAVYRDNCKVGQPLSTVKKERSGADTATRIVEKVVEVTAPQRTKLPRRRVSQTFQFRVADCKGFVTIGEYEDGRPGEVFIKVSKQGSTLAGVMDAFAIAISHGLQYGVPVRAYVEAFTNMRFEPAGMTDDPDIRIASSILDYIFRRIAVDYLPVDERTEMGIQTVAERTEPTLPGVEEAVTANQTSHDLSGTWNEPEPTDSDTSEPVVAPRKVYVPDAPLCPQDGQIMVRSGSCFSCQSCGNSSGCS